MLENSQNMKNAYTKIHGAPRVLFFVASYDAVVYTTLLS